jgi:hypothetical protein
MRARAGRSMSSSKRAELSSIRSSPFPHLTPIFSLPVPAPSPLLTPCPPTRTLPSSAYVLAAPPSSGSTRTSARCCASALADDRFSFALRSQASGNVGKPILKALLDAGQFELTVLSRKESNATFPTGAKVVKTDFSADSLADLFRGQDVVISAVTTQAVDEQIKFIDAALKAGVKRFITSDVRPPCRK